MGRFDHPGRPDRFDHPGRPDRFDHPGRPDRFDHPEDRFEERERSDKAFVIPR